MSTYGKIVLACDRGTCFERYEEVSTSAALTRVNAFDNAGFVQRNGKDYCRRHGAEVDAASAAA